MSYRSKSISLDEDVWKAFDAAREVHGSYNKFLRVVLSAGGVFGAGDGSAPVMESLGTSQAFTADTQFVTGTATFKRGKEPQVTFRPHMIHSGVHPIQGCAQCAALK